MKLKVFNMKFNMTSIMASIGLLLLLQSCLKDTGNYDYNYGNVVTAALPSGTFSARLGDTVTMAPQLTFSNPDDTLEFDHEWYLFGELYSEERQLEYVPTILGYVYFTYYIVDRRTGIRYRSQNSGTINVTSPFQTGWGLLYERDGASELGHVILYNDQYVDYYDIYQEYNDGEQLGSQPVRIQDYPVTGGRGMYVLQHGGQGSVELDAYSMRKQLVASESFTGAVPIDFAPVDFGFYNLMTTDLLVNQDGRVFSRSFASGSPAYTYPWIGTPLTIAGGMEITDIWDSWSSTSGIALMYDRLNKRVLMTTTGYTSGGALTIIQVPSPSQPYPDEYTPLDNLGDWEYRWGGTLSDQTLSTVGAMIIKNPTDQQYYFQTFQARTLPNTITPQGTRRLFSGSSLIREDTKFETIKSRNYIFFDSDNALYYYDNVTGETKHYITFNSKITALRTNDQGLAATLGLILAVGLEDGTFILYDISDPTLIAGQVSELHRATGFGKIVDIVNKGGRSTNG